MTRSRLLTATASLAALFAAGCTTDGGAWRADTAQASAGEPDLISRSALFGNPTRAQARLSPYGDYLSWLAPDEGVLNVWVAPTDNLDAARAITEDRGRGIRNYGWAANGKTLVYLQDRGGDENFRLYSVDVASGEELDLTPFEGVRALPYATSWSEPDVFLVGVNDRDAAWHDLYRINVTNGERELVYENTDQIGGYTFDTKLNMRLGERSEADGSSTVLKRVGDGWESFISIPYEDNLTTGVLGFDESDARFHMLESIGRDKSALVLVDYETGERKLLAESDQADVADIMTHPVTRAVEAYAVNYLKTEWTPIGSDVAGDLDFLSGQLDGELEIVSRTKDDDRWVIAQIEADAPVAYHLYDRSGKALSKLFTTRPDLEGAPLAPMQPLELTSRDGLTMVSYLTLPPNADSDGDGRPDEPLPMVLNVHGGPWARDSYGYDGWHQWLANRGYAVLSVNFRSSTGFGKAFIRAGDLEWSGKMHDDLIDAVNWAVENGVADKEKVAIAGGSYGGYAALVGVTYTPETFACAVDIVGPSNLETLLETIPPYWASFYESLARSVGDPRTEEGLAHLKATSPLYKAGEIVKPLLIGQGANDPRVKQAESDQIVEAMKAKGVPVTYILFPDEGHGFARPENRFAFYAVMEAFLAKCLGGRYEPVGDAFDGSSLQAVHGAEFAPGLADALEGFEAEERG